MRGFAVATGKHCARVPLHEPAAVVVRPRSFVRSSARPHLSPSVRSLPKVHCIGSLHSRNGLVLPVSATLAAPDRRRSRASTRALAAAVRRSAVVSPPAASAKTSSHHWRPGRTGARQLHEAARALRASSKSTSQVFRLTASSSNSPLAHACKQSSPFIAVAAGRAGKIRIARQPLQRDLRLLYCTAGIVVLVEPSPAVGNLYERFEHEWLVWVK